MLKIAVALAVLSLLFAAPALATPASVPAAFPWIDGEAEPLLVDGDTVYVGGTFDTVGTAAGPLVLADGGDATLLKRFTGLATWRQWGTQPYWSLEVLSVIGDGAGGWYAGGAFTTIDGAFRNGIIHLRADGSLDPAFNAFEEEGAGHLALVGDRLFATWNEDISVLDARTGERLDVTIHAPSVNALAGDANTLFVGSYSGVRAYDAVSGAMLPFQPPIGVGSEVSDVAVAGDTVYLAGDFDVINGRQTHGAAAFRRSDGALLPTVFEGVDHPERVRVSASAVIWGGENLIASDRTTGANLGWFAGASGGPMAVDGDRLYQPDSAYSLSDGSRLSWSPALYGEAMTIAASGGKVLIGGSPMATHAVTRHNLAAFSLSTGEVLPFAPSITGIDWVRVNSLVKHGGALYAGGRFRWVNGEPQSNVAKLDPTTGARLPFPGDSESTVWSLAVGGDTLFVGRSGLIAYDLATATRLSWQPPGLDCDVYSLTVSSATLHAGGCFRGGLASFRVADRTRVPSPTLNSTVKTVAPDGAGGVWVGGFDAPHLWHVGTAGQLVDDAPTVDGNVFGIVAEDGVLSLAGSFERIQGRAHPGAGQVRLADGTLTTFNPGVQSVHSLKALPGDGLLLGLYGPSTGLRVTGPVARFGPWAPVAAPTLTRAPRVTGAAVGTEHNPTDAHTDGGEWSAPIAARSLRWLRCDASGGACVEADYELTEEDAGHRMRVEVTVSNDGGSTTALSELGPLLGRVPSFNSGQPPALSGTARAGETVHADPGSTVPASQITYTWTRCNPSTGYCVTVNPGSLSLTLTDADVGQRISFTAVARNQFGKSLPWTVSFPNPVAPRADATPTPTPTATPTATATPTPTPTATATATAAPTPTPEPTPTATATAEPTMTASPTPATNTTRTSASPARAPRARLTATRTRVTVTLTAPAPHKVTVRLLSNRTLLGRATLRPGTKRATVALTKQGKAALRRHRTITLETRTAAGTTRTRTRL